MNGIITDSQDLLFAKKLPWVVAANTIMAMKATMKTNNAFIGVTSISNSSVLKMNRNGGRTVQISYIKPWTPVLIGPPPEIAAAAKAASPTGGVSSKKPAKGRCINRAVESVTTEIDEPIIFARSKGRDKGIWVGNIDQMKAMPGMRLHCHPVGTWPTESTDFVSFSATLALVPTWAMERP